MIVKPFGNTQIFICEDTAECIIKGIEETNVYQVAEFLESMNYVVRYIAGSKKAAEDLQYYTSGEIVDINNINLHVKDLS